MVKKIKAKSQKAKSVSNKKVVIKKKVQKVVTKKKPSSKKVSKKLVVKSKPVKKTLAKSAPKKSTRSQGQKVHKQTVLERKAVDLEQKSNMLIEKGKKRGFVTYDEMIKMFPDLENNILFLDDKEFSL